MAAERTLESLANRLLSLDSLIQTRSDEEKDTYAFVEQMKNGNTKKKTKSDLQRVRTWLESVGETRDLNDIPPEELNILLARLFLNIKKVDGADYEPATIKSIQSSIHRFLTDKDYNGNILQDMAFKHSRDVISSKRKLLKEHGKGNKQKRSDPFTDEELKILYDKGLLGGDNPQALSNSMWLNNTIHFGLRGRQEHTTMLWGDIELQQTSSGDEYLAFTERLTKTRNGVSSDPRAYIPKMFAQPGDENCPVMLYKLYAEKRPVSMNKPDARFYVAVNPQYGNGKANGDNWYIKSHMGKNKLGQLGKVMSEQANLSGRHTNHSGRKTCITKLLNSNVAPSDVAQLSGHRNLLSLNQYNTVSIEKQKEMSTIVHKCSTTSTNITSNTAVDDMSDSELVAASQEIEEALHAIENYEGRVANIEKNDDIQRVDLPVVHNSDGSLSVHRNFDPKHFFVNCTFNAAVNIVMK